jgi:hypothetical protein
MNFRDEAERECGGIPELVDVDRIAQQLDPSLFSTASNCFPAPKDSTARQSTKYDVDYDPTRLWNVSDFTPLCGVGNERWTRTGDGYSIIAASDICRILSPSLSLPVQPSLPTGSLPLSWVGVKWSIESTPMPCLINTRPEEGPTDGRIYQSCTAAAVHVMSYVSRFIFI